MYKGEHLVYDLANDWLLSKKETNQFQGLLINYIFLTTTLFVLHGCFKQYEIKAHQL